MGRSGILVPVTGWQGAGKHPMAARPGGDFKFGRNVDLLANGDIEADFCAVQSGATIQEVNESTGTPQIVWQAVAPGAGEFRAERLSSLYPGIQW